MIKVLGIIFVLLGYQQNSLASKKATPSSGGASCAHPTIYYKPTVDPSASCSGSRSSITVVSGQGSKTLSVCSNQARTLRIEGSGRVQDSKNGEAYVINVIGGSRFLRLSPSEAKRCPHGYGVRQICLDPFSTVAADLRYYNPGDVLYFENLVGMSLPAGYTVNGKSQHDGYVIVRDTGPRSQISGAGRFDFFTGGLSDTNSQNPMARKGFADRNHCFKFRKLSAAEASAVRTQRGYPNLR